MPNNRDAQKNEKEDEQRRCDGLVCDEKSGVFLWQWWQPFSEDRSTWSGQRVNLCPIFFQATFSKWTSQVAIGKTKATVHGTKQTLFELSHKKIMMAAVLSHYYCSSQCCCYCCCHCAFCYYCCWYYCCYYCCCWYYLDYCDERRKRSKWPCRWGSKQTSGE